MVARSLCVSELEPTMDRAPVAGARGPLTSAHPGELLLARILHAQQAIHRAEGVEGIAHALVDQATFVAEADVAMASIARHGEPELAVRAGAGLRLDTLRMADGTTMTGRCLRDRRAIVCADSETDERVDRVSFRRSGTRSVAVLPIAAAGDPFGAVVVGSALPEALSPATLDGLALLASFAGVAIGRAREVERLSSAVDEQMRLNAALDAFASHAAHDIKAPLAAAFVAAKTARFQVEPAPAEVETTFDILERQLGRATDVVADLLALARASHTPRVEDIELVELVDSIVVDSSSVVLEGCDDVVIRGDRVGLRHAVANLVANAETHAAVDGVARITVTCEVRPGGGGWRVSVADRGPGIEPGERRRLFDPFRRGDRATDRDGTGLGLAIVANVAAAHGGRAGCDPREGGGGVFWFEVAESIDERTRRS